VRCSVHYFQSFQTPAHVVRSSYPEEVDVYTKHLTLEGLGLALSLLAI